MYIIRTFTNYSFIISYCVPFFKQEVTLIIQFVFQYFQSFYNIEIQQLVSVMVSCVGFFYFGTLSWRCWFWFNWMHCISTFHRKALILVFLQESFFYRRHEHDPNPNPWIGIGKFVGKSNKLVSPVSYKVWITKWCIEYTYAFRFSPTEPSNYPLQTLMHHF